MFRAVVVFCAVVALTEGWNWNTTQVTRCLLHSSGPLPINVYIAGCTTSPCRLEQQRDAVIEIVFLSPYEIHRMRTTLWAYINIFGIQYNLGEIGETCNFLSNGHCPVMEGEVVKSMLHLPIEEFLPVGTTLPIEIRIQDDETFHNIVCFRWVLEVVAPGSG